VAGAGGSGGSTNTSEQNWQAGMVGTAIATGASEGWMASGDRSLWALVRPARRHGHARRARALLRSEAPLRTVVAGERLCSNGGRRGLGGCSPRRNACSATCARRRRGRRGRVRWSGLHGRAGPARTGTARE